MNKLNEYQAVGKIDYQWNANRSGRYLATAYSLTPPYSVSNGNVLTTTNPGFDDLAQHRAWAHLHMSATTERLAADNQPDRGNAPARTVFLGSEMASKLQFIEGFHGSQRNRRFQYRRELGQPRYVSHHGYQLSDDLSLVRGNHQTSSE